MDLDFKDRTFSFLKLKKKKLRRKIVFFLFIFLLMAVFLFYKDHSAYKKVKKAEGFLLTGEILKCSILIDKDSSSFFRRSSFNDLEGILNLIGDNIEKGKSILTKSKPGRSSINSEKVLAYLSDNCFYKQLDIYSSLLPEDNDFVRFYRIVSDTSLYRADESGRKIKEFEPEDPDTYSKHLSILKEINHKVKRGKIEFIYDRDGEALASYDIEQDKCISLIPGINFDNFNNSLRNGIEYIKLSIDKDVQLKLHRLFNKYYGSFVLTDLEDGSIIAAYSKPFNGNDDNTALTGEYEPGSIIKLMTLFTYFNSKTERIFPFNCIGYTSYDGKIFYDWIRHGILQSPEKALSHSCNIAFSEMGIKSGAEKIHKVLENFMFNSEPSDDGIFQFRFGRFSSEDHGERALANISIGLEHISITTIHSAIISSIIAQNGNIIFPYIIMSNQNIFNLGYYNHNPENKKIYLNNRFFENIKSGMKEVTTDPKGTGRRAKVDFMDIGLKTGTAGEKSKGLDSVLTGFFPFEKPRYSFAFRLEHGGKAEYNGALFLRKFLKAFYEKE